MKVLHLPTATGGNAWGLSRGERARGLQSDVLVEGNSYLNYPSDINLNLHVKNQNLPWGIKKLNSFCLKLKAFFEIRNSYEIFHFNGGKSLLHNPYIPLFNQPDLPYYPKPSKLFVTYNGSDARQGVPSLKRAGLPYTKKQDTSKRKSIEKMARYVDWIWAVNPDLLYYLPKEKSSFLPYTIANFDPSPSFPTFNGSLKIVHAPTNQEIKGSQYVLDAVEKLNRKYSNQIDFQLIQGLSHQEALQKYREADLVIDQLRLGWYGAFAVEVMLMGKPVVVYIAEEDLKFVPSEMSSELLNAVVHANPSMIYQVLEQCLDSRDSLKEKSRASFEYARKWHHPAYVASITKDRYERS